LIDEDKFIIIRYSINELNVSDFDFRDFFASMALKIYETAASEVKLEKDIEDDFKEFMMNITKVSEQDVTSYSKTGLSFSKLIILKLGREEKTREFVRKELETKISDLIQKLNWLIREVENKANKKIVIVVDDLDKLTRGQQAEDFFYKNYRLLIQPNCFIIYTFPIPAVGQNSSIPSIQKMKTHRLCSLLDFTSIFNSWNEFFILSTLDSHVNVPCIYCFFRNI
jgi:hypothetical protein